MSDFLPEGIITNILKRLPVKPLIRCMSVSRSWYTLITSPEFISIHLNFSVASSEGSPLLLLRRCIRKNERYELFYDNESFDRHFRLQFPFRSINSFFTIIGSCNGLLCLSDDRVFYMNTIIIWNPCVKKSVLPPKPNMVYNSYGSFMQSLGFGFDPVRNDYKVVRITYTDLDRCLPQVELYRLSIGVWQDISHLSLQYVIHNKSRQAYINGAAHWIGRDLYGNDTILLFDMCDEVFRTVILPGSLAKDDSARNKELMIYKESLAFVLYDVSGVEHDFCVWVMEEYGVVESWNKQFNINFHDFGRGFMKPLWIRRDGEVLIVTKDGSMVSCGSSGEEVTDLGVHGSRLEEYLRSVHVDGYIKSLVLLEKGPHFTDSITLRELPSLQSDDCDSDTDSGSDYNKEVNTSTGQNIRFQF
ncbi:F-box kelch-repeat At3g06240-like [Olea europaea subsp. europaea]|uniref:F-box kelch-repeat At3g06240-like n=1 Tax=Olea europaea subsp. europaea TaxID=158383 RepID=A0A8S0UBP6_OLEEU|nr:F-box kelch-repeat At3g06240-like [Olea europaea subsp. europaea]